MDEAAEPVMWLRGVIDEIERECQNQENVARTMRSTELAEMAVRAVEARIQAERAILDVHRAMHRPVWPARRRPDGGYTVDYYPDQFDCERCSDEDPRAYASPWPCDTVLWLAYGHRFDASGWRDEWAPEPG